MINELPFTEEQKFEAYKVLINFIKADKLVQEKNIQRENEVK